MTPTDEVLRLKESGLTCKQVAAKLGMTPGQISGILFRARHPNTRAVNRFAKDALRANMIIEFCQTFIEEYGQMPARKILARGFSLTPGQVSGIIERAGRNGLLPVRHRRRAA